MSKSQTKRIKFMVLVVFILSHHAWDLNAQSIEGSFESRFKRYQKGDVYEGEVIKTWNTSVWKGERIHKQLILWSSTDVSGISFAIEDMVGDKTTIPKSAVHFRFADYVKGDAEARSCSEYELHSTDIEIADALLDTEINSISPSDPLKVWVTIDVPTDVEEGLHTGKIVVEGVGSPLSFTIELNVVDYVLPDVENWNFHLDLWQFPTKVLDHYNDSNPNNPIDLWSQQHFDMLEPSYRLLADMGQKAVTAYVKAGSLGAPSMVDWTLTNQGTWTYDFTVFEKYVDFMFSLGISKQIDCFSPVGWNEDVIPYFDEASGAMKELQAPLNSVVYQQRWDHFLSAFKVFLDEKGWFDKVVLYLDEVTEEKLNSVNTVVHGNHPDWKLGIAYSHGLSVASKSFFYDLSGILEDASNQGVSEDKISTFYTSCTQRFPNSYVTPENNPAEMVWMGWHALSEKYDGYLRWAYDYWQQGDPFDMRDGGHTAGDFGLVYRNSNNLPMTYSSSIRMEMLREGIQDYEKVKLLKTRLEESNDPYDLQALEGLNEMIEQFGKTSGEAASDLIPEAQELVAQIVTETFSYCRAGGGNNHDFYVKSLTTIGANENISFSVNEFPNAGYVHHTSTSLQILPGTKITISAENSVASNCAWTRVWVDWNGDENFEIEEEVYSHGTNGSCDSPTSHSFTLVISEDQPVGEFRMRVRVVESNEGEPSPCGASDKSGTVDFNIKISDLYCQPVGGDHDEYFVAKLETFDGEDDQNIQYTASGFPENGYNYFNEGRVVLERGTIFKVLINNSQAAGCARSVIWIDWNGDKDFDDEDENAFDGNNIFQSCDNPLVKSAFITVPLSARSGLTRMRIQLRDAWEPEPEACVSANFTGTTDFDLEIVEGIVSRFDPTLSDSRVIVYPNPNNTGQLQIKGLNGFKNTLKVLIFNLSGQLEYNQIFNKSQPSDSIKLSFSQQGVFLLKISDGLHQETRRITLKH